LEGIDGDMLYGHKGQFIARERVQQSHWWKGMDQDINEFLKNVINVRKQKKFKYKTKNKLKPLPLCSEPNQRIHLDLIGPLKTTESGKKYITDVFSRFAELIAMPDKHAETVAEAFHSRWLCRYSAPSEIFSGQAKEFFKEVVDKLLGLLKVKKTTKSPYHP
jgi:hypothetical protein